MADVRSKVRIEIEVLFFLRDFCLFWCGRSLYGRVGVISLGAFSGRPLKEKEKTEEERKNGRRMKRGDKMEKLGEFVLL